MFAGLRAWSAAHQGTQRRDITLLTLVATVAVLLACSLGGGGTTATTGCAKPTSGCYAVQQYYALGKDFTATPHGVYDAIDLDALGCDANCVSEKGYIANYLMLTSTNLAAPWMQVGYRATGFQNGNTVYYTAFYDGSTLAFHDFAPVPSADYTSEGQFAINAVTGSDFYVRYAGPSAWNIFDYGKLASFTPGAAEFGEILHGTKGESAAIEWYQTGNYTDVDQGSIHNAPPTLAEFPKNLIVVEPVLADNPPYGKWITIEGSPVWFETACCSAPL